MPASDFDAVVSVVADVSKILEAARTASARSVNSLLTASYWAIGRRIVQEEQRGKRRAAYGVELIRRLADALRSRYGRGFGQTNLSLMRAFYLAYEHRSDAASHALRPLLGESESRRFFTQRVKNRKSDGFPLPWRHYVCLLKERRSEVRDFYEAEALRGGWTIRQLQRQIDTNYFERAKRPAPGRSSHGTEPEHDIKDPFLLEFLDLTDEPSEQDLENALIRHLESFLLELGGDFTFAGRQRRCRIGDEWYRIDLLLFHRRLRCLILIDLKLDAFTPGDVGQMNFYLNYARENWTLDDENPPVGLILSAGQSAAVAHYAFQGIANNILAAEYLTKLPEEQRLVDELNRTRRLLEARRPKPKK